MSLTEDLRQKRAKLRPVAPAAPYRIRPSETHQQLRRMTQADASAEMTEAPGRMAAASDSISQNEKSNGVVNGVSVTADGRTVEVLPAPQFQAGDYMKNKFTETTKTIILGYMRQGAHLGVAAKAAGVSTELLRMWLTRGREQQEGPWRDFLDEVDQARAIAETKTLKVIDDSESWVAAAWKLEHRYPKRWGAKSTTTVQGPDGGPVKHQVAVMMVPVDRMKEALALAPSNTVDLESLGETAVDIEDDDSVEEVE